MIKSKLASVFFLFLFCVGIFIAQATSHVFAQGESRNTRDRYIVVLQDTSEDPTTVANDLARTHGLALGHVYKKALRGFSARVSEGRLNALKKDKRVRFVTEDKLVNIEAPRGPSGKPRKPTPTPTATPIPTPTSTPTATPIPTPTPTPTRWITVVSPNGGEVLQVGQTYRITWNASSVIDKVWLGYKSCPSCLDWIVTDYPNTGYYDWYVYVGNTTNTQFRIDLTGYQTGFGSATDQSDAPFTVLQLTPTPTPIPTFTPTPSPTLIPTPSPQSTPSGIRRIGLNSLKKGTGVTVAVLDTGIDLTHPDLSGNIVASTSCVASAPSGNDDNGHGSHVAGTIAALDNTIGVVGVAPDARLAAVKVLDASGWGYWSEIICGIDWVTANAATYNIRVANMSLGGTGTSDNNCGNTNLDPLHQAICNSTAAGVTYVVSAGNSSKDAATAVPAAYDDTVITVSALADSDGAQGGLGGSTLYGSDDTFATFSNYGSVVDIAGPGVSIFSSYKNGGYTSMSGTSMAAPHVSGTAALYVQSQPFLSFTQLRDALIAAAEQLGNGHTDPSGIHPEPVIHIASF